MSRRLSVTVRGLPVEVVYTERGQDVVWYLASVNWRLIACDRPLALTDREIRAIDAACMSDLIERRRAWQRQLSARREVRHAS
jgi:hypothetical protein